MKLLVVEDDEVTAGFLKRGLSEEGFAIDTASDADEADLAVGVNSYDLILLDAMLPRGDGFELCRDWRERGVRAPVLFVTARDEVADRVQGLNLGGDDYLVKPFSFDELVARIRALLRRGPAPLAPTVLKLGDLEIDTRRRVVERAGHPIPLTTREFQILEHLARADGGVISRTDLWEHVWESDQVPDSNVIDVYIGYLRAKLGRDPDLIRTVRGAGYALRLPDAPTQ
jgi:two-component system copper resistance phosphate regulon response regulator CusR